MAIRALLMVVPLAFFPWASSRRTNSLIGVPG